MKKIIGTATRYHGSEHSYLRGYKVRIVAVLKNRLDPHVDPDIDGAYITDDEELARAGGVTAFDRSEVKPYLAKEGRYSFVGSDARAVDLACYAELAKKNGANR